MVKLNLKEIEGCLNVHDASDYPSILCRFVLGTQVSECLFCFFVILLKLAEIGIQRSPFIHANHPLVLAASVLYYPAAWALLARNIWMTAMSLLRVSALLFPLQVRWRHSANGCYLLNSSTQLCFLLKAHSWLSLRRQLALFLTILMLSLLLMVATAVCYTSMSRIGGGGNYTDAQRQQIRAENNLITALLVVRLFQSGLPVPLVLVAALVMASMLLFHRPRHLCICHKVRPHAAHNTLIYFIWLLLNFFAHAKHAVRQKMQYP